MITVLLKKSLIQEVLDNLVSKVHPLQESRVIVLASNLSWM